MADIFKLPVSSYDEIAKIIRAYGNGKIGRVGKVIWNQQICFK